MTEHGLQLRAICGNSACGEPPRRYPVEFGARQATHPRTVTLFFAMGTRTCRLRAWACAEVDGRKILLKGPYLTLDPFYRILDAILT